MGHLLSDSTLAALHRLAVWRNAIRAGYPSQGDGPRGNGFAGDGFAAEMAALLRRERRGAAAASHPGTRGLPGDLMAGLAAAPVPPARPPRSVRTAQVARYRQVAALSPAADMPG